DGGRDAAPEVRVFDPEEVGDLREVTAAVDLDPRPAALVRADDQLGQRVPVDVSDGDEYPAGERRLEWLHPEDLLLRLPIDHGDQVRRARAGAHDDVRHPVPVEIRGGD